MQTRNSPSREELRMLAETAGLPEEMVLGGSKIDLYQTLQNSYDMKRLERLSTRHRRRMTVRGEGGRRGVARARVVAGARAEERGAEMDVVEETEARGQGARRPEDGEEEEEDDYDPIMFEKLGSHQ